MRTRLWSLLFLTAIFTTSCGIQSPRVVFQERKNLSAIVDLSEAFSGGQNTARAVMVVNVDPDRSLAVAHPPISGKHIYSSGNLMGDSPQVGAILVFADSENSNRKEYLQKLYGGRNVLVLQSLSDNIVYRCVVWGEMEYVGPWVSLRSTPNEMISGIPVYSVDFP